MNKMITIIITIISTLVGCLSLLFYVKQKKLSSKTMAYKISYKQSLRSQDENETRGRNVSLEACL